MRILNALSTRTLLVSVALAVVALGVELVGGGASPGAAQAATLGAAPATNPGLTADCDALLRAKATLLHALKGLGLSRNQLAGAIPPVLRDCVIVLPPPDPQPGAFRYNYLDTTGRVETPGSYAFLKDSGDEAEGGRDRRAPGSVVLTTYEGLRKEANRLLVHERDAGGTSRAGSYDAVRVGDLIEWRKSEDCFVRYRVRSLPAAAQSPREFGVERETYAFTGCLDGTVPVSEAIEVKAAAELPLTEYRSTSLRFPVVHGPFQIVPKGWTGAVEEGEAHEPPRGYYWDPVNTTDLAAARKLPYWRDPALPADWTFRNAYSGGYVDPLPGYCAIYENARGYFGIRICGVYAMNRIWPQTGHSLGGRGVRETRSISGRPGVASYDFPGPNSSVTSPIQIHIHDPNSETIYELLGYDPNLRGSNIESIIMIARSLFESPNPR